jgi:hypothetical protein
VPQLTKFPLILLALSSLGCQSHHPDGTTEPKSFSTTDWQTVLERVVTSDGYVKYEVLKNNAGGARDALTRFVDQIARVSPESHPGLFLADKDRLAYFINAYNATAMRAVLQANTPEDVRPVIDHASFKYGGHDMSLDAVAKHVRKLGDPGVWFALNDMARSSPPLRQEPYTGMHLDGQLDDQARRYLADPRGVAADPKTGAVLLSEILAKTHADDFKTYYERKTGKKNAELIDALRIFAGPDSPLNRASRIDTMKFDGSINQAR